MESAKKQSAKKKRKVLADIYKIRTLLQISEVNISENVRSKREKPHVGNETTHLIEPSLFALVGNFVAPARRRREERF